MKHPLPEWQRIDFRNQDLTPPPIAGPVGLLLKICAYWMLNERMMLRSVSVLAIILAFCMVVPPWHWPEYIASFLWRGIYVTSVIVAVAAGMFLLMLNVIIFMTDGTRRGAFILIAVSLFAIALGSTVARCVYPLAVAEGEQDDSQDHQERKTSK